MKKTIIVKGMDTLQKGRVITDILEELDHVSRVTLNLEEESLIVEYPRGTLTEDDFYDILSEEGFEITDICDE